VGGGSKSDAWIQLTADIFARPIIRPEITEAGALGAAILAGAATGVFSSVEEGCQAMIRLGRSFEPQPKNLPIYDDYFNRYAELWPMMSSYLRRL
jgi:xylulokinase